MIRDDDKPADKAAKQLMQKQIKWCRKHVDIIENRANKVYDMVVNHPDKNRNLVKRSSKFDKLETLLDKLLNKV
ncbi:MAG: type III toxin-antitoxin system ToxN/AbiQ family toxin [Lachnospiraceae bacterium]|nr:type III toxin-antitoxin system ToxN/AbiQ family toxin [Lachnospiraceae bacterium]